MLHEAQALGRQILWHQSSYLRLLFLLPKDRTRAKDAPTPGSLGCWQVVGSNHTWHGTGERQGELHGTFVLRFFREQNSCSFTFISWQFIHHRSRMGAVAGTPRHEGLCRHAGRQSLFQRARAYFIIGFVQNLLCIYTYLLHKIELHQSNGYIRKQCHNVCILPHEVIIKTARKNSKCPL